MQRGFLLRVGLTWVLLPAFGGCAGPRAVGKDGPLTVSSRPYEPDIPLPVGFAMVDQSSEDWSGGAIRYVRHRYVGRADKRAVRTFYREQMPLVRWTAIGDGVVHGRITMRFERAGESCTVTIEDERGGVAKRAAVEVLITPLRRERRP